MVKQMITASALAAMLMFSGCGDGSAGSDRLKAQQDLDVGNFSSAIANLESKTDKTNEDNMLLASAYLGEAGFSFSDTIGIVAGSGSGETDSFTSFAQSVTDVKDENTLDNLSKAITYYKAIDSVSQAPAYKAPKLGTTNDVLNSLGDTNLFLGLAYLTKATVVMSYLGDISKLQNKIVDPELMASGCAIIHVYAPSTPLPTGCVSVANVPDGNYTRLDIILDNANGKTFHRLADKNLQHMVLSDYATNTPVLVDGIPLTVQDALVDTINNAFEFIISLAPDDVKNDIYSYKRDLLELGNNVDVSNTPITYKHIADYIAKKGN